MHPKSIPLKFWTILSILLVGLVCYANSFDVPFVFDDIGYIQGNIKIRDITKLHDIWNALPNPSRFVGMLTFAVNYHFHQYNLFGYHLTNFLIHMTNALLVWWLVQSLGKTPRVQAHYSRAMVDQISWIAALLFVAHPMQTQAITYIAQRFASLSTLFYLLSACLYIHARCASKGRVVYAFLSMLAAIIGMATKQIVMTLPLMILWMEFLFIYQAPEGQGKRKIPWKVIAPVVLFIFIVPSFYSFDIASRFYEEGVVRNGSHRGDLLSTKIYLLTQFCVVATYLRLLVFPIGQNLLWDFRSSMSLFEPKTFFCLLLLLTILAWGIYLIRRNRLLAFGILWFFTALLVESSIIMIKHVIFEHRVYLPSFGFCLFMATGLSCLFKDARKLIAVVCMIILTLGFLTHQRNEVWRSDITLWEDGIKKAPDKSRPYMNLGIAHMARGQYKESIEQFGHSLEKNPRNYGAYSNRGTSYFAMGAYPLAYQDFNKAIEIKEDYTEAYINRGNYYAKIKEFEKSIADYNKALEISPESAEALVNRGNKYARLKQYERALEDYNQALELSPKFAQGYRNRANVYEKMKSLDKALADYNTAIELAQHAPDYYYHRGNVYHKKGLWQKALNDYNKALEISPDYLKAYSKRAGTYMKVKEYQSALNDFLYMQNRGVQIDPKYISRVKQLASESP